jgi:hypothetical protein
MRERAELASASSAESDRYEELLVNPTLIALSQAGVEGAHEILPFGVLARISMRRSGARDEDDELGASLAHHVSVTAALNGEFR